MKDATTIKDEKDSLFSEPQPPEAPAPIHLPNKFCEALVARGYEWFLPLVLSLPDGHAVIGKLEATQIAQVLPQNQCLLAFALKNLAESVFDEEAIAFLQSSAKSFLLHPKNQMPKSQIVLTIYDDDGAGLPDHAKSVDEAAPLSTDCKFVKFRHESRFGDDSILHLRRITAPLCAGAFVEFENGLTNSMFLFVQELASRGIFVSFSRTNELVRSKLVEDAVKEIAAALSANDFSAERIEKMRATRTLSHINFALCCRNYEGRVEKSVFELCGLGVDVDDAVWHARRVVFSLFCLSERLWKNW